jgi:hypothetical protein
MGEAAGLRHVSTSFSADGGNVIAVFMRENDEERRASGLESSAARTRDILLRHTTARHYLTPTPYIRVVDRLARRWQEANVLRRFRTLEDVLGWVSGSGHD